MNKRDYKVYTEYVFSNMVKMTWCLFIITCKILSVGWTDPPLLPLRPLPSVPALLLSTPPTVPTPLCPLGAPERVR